MQLDIDDLIARRQNVIDAWKRWDEEPGNERRARDMTDACVAYAGFNSLQFCRYIAAARRNGADIEAALELWEGDW